MYRRLPYFVLLSVFSYSLIFNLIQFIHFNFAGNALNEFARWGVDSGNKIDFKSFLKEIGNHKSLLCVNAGVYVYVAQRINFHRIVGCAGIYSFCQKLRQTPSFTCDEVRSHQLSIKMNEMSMLAELKMQTGKFSAYSAVAFEPFSWFMLSCIEAQKR